MYTVCGNYINPIKENFTSYINSYNNINTLSNMTIQEIVDVLPQLSIIDCASLLSTMCDIPENIKRVSQILLLVPVIRVYSIIPTMTVGPSYVSISKIVSILLNMSISIIALIIANMTIPQIITIPTTSNYSLVINLQKGLILSDPSMPISKAALILSDNNISINQAALILSNMSFDKSLLILSDPNMSSDKASLISLQMKKL